MTVEVPNPEGITGVILAGGKARRMGGDDKGLVDFAGRPLVAWVIDSLRPQVGALVINANRNHDRYARYGYPVIADAMTDFQGPLAGFSAALAEVRTPWIVTVPCDGPYPAPDLVQRLCDALAEQGAELAVASDGQRMQPVYALIPRALALGSGGVPGRRGAQDRPLVCTTSDRPRRVRRPTGLFREHQCRPRTSSDCDGSTHDHRLERSVARLLCLQRYR